MNTWLFTFHIVLDSIAIVANVLVLTLILDTWLRLKTCKARSYRALIFNLALFDLLAAITDLFLLKRTIHYKDKILYESTGLCSSISTTACVYGIEFLLHLYTHCVWLVFVSYVYRYISLIKGEVKHAYLAIAVFGIYTLSILQMVFLNKSVIVDTEVITLIILKYPNEHFNIDYEHAYFGFNSTYDWNMILALSHISLPITPLLIIEVILGWKVYQHLRSNLPHLSEVTKDLHWQLLKALICQTTLPILWFLGIITFILARLDLLHPVLSEYSTCSLFIIIPVLGPLFNLYFIKTFRVRLLAWMVYIKKLLGFKTSKVSFGSTAVVLSTTV